MTHRLLEVARRSSAAWQSRCVCRWVSPWVESRRTAVHALTGHARGER